MTLLLSLFPGIGLLDHAFEAEGFCVVRGPDVLWGGDVRAFKPPAGVFDGIIGGPPCQTFSSLANLVRAKGNETRFGNLIPEFERCVAAAGPKWFLMENVPRAPVPEVEGYAVASFVICNSEIAGPDGFGQEQRRRRRFSFGVRGAQSAPDLRWWIRPPALLKALQPTVVAAHSDIREYRVGRLRSPAVTASEGSAYETRLEPSRSIAEMLRLQGFPEDFLDHAPFTAHGKRQVIGNGVPLPMGRALARAIIATLEERSQNEAVALADMLNLEKI